jgi:DegV family protein with EDD domain
MGSVCIITDSTVQFPQPAFTGRNLVKILPLHVNLAGKVSEESPSPKNYSLPAIATKDLAPSISILPIEEFTAFIESIGKSFDQSLWLLHSSALSQCFQKTSSMLDQIAYHGRLQLIDSQNISIGLGLLVQLAAELATQGAPLSEIEREIRTNIQRIYTVLSIPNLSYLFYASLIDLSQATVGEMMDILPIFTLEEGVLTPVDKVKSNRQVFDFFLEFINEYDHLVHLSLLQNASPNNPNARMLREFIQNNFPKANFTEHTLALPVAALFGPHCTGLFLSEAGNHKENKR